MIGFLKPPAHRESLPDDEVDATYRRLRLQVFVGIFVGYAGYYLVRKNFSLAMPYLIEQGYSKTDLGFALSGVAIAYGLSKFFMGNVSDRSNARTFMALGLLCSSVIMIFMGTIPFATSSVSIMFVLLMANGWFQGMGWPPSGRVMVHWFSSGERGTKMAIWNVAHNIGGGMVGPIAILAMAVFADWHAILYVHGFFSLAIALLILALVRDTPQSEGLGTIEAIATTIRKHLSTVKLMRMSFQQRQSFSNTFLTTSSCGPLQLLTPLSISCATAYWTGRQPT